MDPEQQEEDDDGGLAREFSEALPYDDREIGFDREDTTASRRSAFSLEDEDAGHYDDNMSAYSRGTAISVQSSFSLEDDGGAHGKYARNSFGPAERGANFVVSLDSGAAATGSAVLINLYDFGGVSGVLNRTVLSSMGMGVFHCAVEAYGTEWSFVFHKERSKNSSSTGVVQNRPQRLKNHNFNQSIEVGWTSWSEEEVKSQVRKLSHQWRARSYHVTRRNCITFAEEFVTRLGLAENFPAWVKRAPELGKSNATLSAVIDNTWDMLAGVESSVEPTCPADDDEVMYL